MGNKKTGITIYHINGEKKWVDSTYKGNVGLLENYVHPYIGDKKLRSIKTKTVDNINMPKMNIIYKFPNLFPGTKTLIVLKQPKRDESIRDVDVPLNVLNSLQILKDMQDKLKAELGPEGYCDYNLAICQAKGRPLMTEHLNKRFKEILIEMNDLEINPEEIVFHSLRNTSTTAKLIMSNGDYNSVMHAGGWSNLEMLTRRYGKHSFASHREKLSDQMNMFKILLAKY